MRYIADLILRRQLKALERKVSFHTLRNAKSALVLYSYRNKEHDQMLRSFCRYLKEEGLEVSSLAFYKKKNKKDEKPQNELNFLYYDKKDLNFLGFPQSSFLKKCMLEDYGLLVDLNLSDEFSLQVISSLSRAKFKVGPSASKSKEILDLSIKTDSKDVQYLIDQMKVYLEMINKQ